MGEVVKFPPSQPGHSYVSPYLLRPLRRKEEVEASRARPGDANADRPPAERNPGDHLPPRTRPSRAAD